MQPANSTLFPFGEYISHRKIRDEVTYNKIQRHLIDVNDRITDDDIRNIKILLRGEHIEDPLAELEKIIAGR
jgi:hypothetical protein